MSVSPNQQEIKNIRETAYITKRDPEKSKVETIRKYMNGAVLVQSSSESLQTKTDFFELQHCASAYSLPLKRVSCTCHSQRPCKLHANDKKVKNHQNMVKEGDDVLESVTQDDAESIYLDDSSTDGKELRRKGSSFKEWMSKKEEEKKRFENSKLEYLEKEEREKQKRLEQERENFKRWLSNKKNREEKTRLEEEKRVKEAQAKANDKERRKKECALRYQLWMKQKEQKYLEKKIQQQLEAEKAEKEKQRRLQGNEAAYTMWLRSSTNKPKPIPSGQGLDSLRSSQSVTYINPVPWASNVEN